ncbi:MAG: hypothetical protein AMXMBFR22_33230 [Phycisphaerae bacterium]
MIALEAVAADARCIRDPKRHDDRAALEEMRAVADLRARDVAPHRGQATVPTRTTVPSVA